MAATMKIKKGDTVQVLAGKDRGKQGRVIERAPARGPRHRREPEPRQAAPQADADPRRRRAWAARR